MQELLSDPGLRESVKSWPATVGDGPSVRNLLFYEDPDFGFVINATVREPDTVTYVHDHGDVWTLYGLIEGNETMYRYERTDAGPRDRGPAVLRLTGRDRIGPGDIDAVPPLKIHQEHAGGTRSIALIVRAKKAGTFEQRKYDPDSGAVEVNYGPGLIPFELA